MLIFFTSPGLAIHLKKNICPPPNETNLKSIHSAGNSGNGPPNQIPILASPPRTRRTHCNPTIIPKLEGLPLFNRLQKNKEIETENLARSFRDLNHSMDPAKYPDPGSEQASLITIETADKQRLKLPSFSTIFQSVIPPYLARWLANEELKERSEKDKRKRDDTLRTHEDTRITKRRCMDGSSHMAGVIGQTPTIKFPQTLFDTELCVAVPLPFFLNKNLRIITDEAAALPTVKSNPLPGETKGTTILDVDKLSLKLGREKELTCSKWTEAAFNYFRFQQERDSEGDGGTFSTRWDQHFTFLHTQIDKDKHYDAWKSVEFDLHQEYHSQPTSFDADYYMAKYDLAKSGSKTLALVKEMMARKPDTQPRDSPTRGFGGFGRKATFTTRSRTHRNPLLPFPSSSTGPPSYACCVLCAERGHAVFSHEQDTSPGQSCQ